MFGWGQNRSVRDWLFAEGHRFNFYQAVRILQWLRRSNSSVGQPAESDDDPVRFRSRVSFGFAASDVHEVSHGANERSVPEMTVNFMGLAGATGPLPVPFAERVIQSGRRKDFAFRDFLDIFNHRLVSLLFRVKQTHQPALTTVSPENGIVAQCLFAILGLGLPSLRDRLWIPDRALLFYAGLLSQRPRSAAGLQRLLSDYFQVDVGVEQFVGAWRDLGSDQWTRLGANGKNCELGQATVLGKRIWDQHGRLLIRLGPMDLKQFECFLPDGSAHKPLRHLTRFYLGEELDFSFQLLLRSPEVPASVLGQSQLGRVAWLKTKTFTQERGEVLLYPES